MTDGALATPSTYAQVRVREPIGERTFGETPTIGGPGSDLIRAADIIVPGTGPGVAVQIERRKGVWIIHPVGDARVRFDGRLLGAPRDLRRHDVLGVGDAQVIVTDVSRTLLRLEVCHLVGNATISPAAAVSAIELDGGDEDLLIQAPRVPTAAELHAAAENARAAAALRVGPPRPPRSRGFWIRIASAAVALVAVMGFIWHAGLGSRQRKPVVASR
jgi:hypothetical protein